MEFAQSLKFKTELIVTESIREVLSQLPKDGFFIVDEVFTDSDWVKEFPNVFYLRGESQKEMGSFENAVKWLFDLKADRNSSIVAIGGGAVTDFAGFLASVFKRGLELLLVPTTVLSAIDSSIGGKTALNYVGKNIVGSFYPAGKVFIATDFFRTLNKEQIISGKAEMVKVALLRCGDFHNSIEKDIDVFSKECIEKAVADKYFFISNDLNDRCGTRIYLNWGHTFGHAIERSYNIPHGIAVANGMVMVQKYIKHTGRTVFDPDELTLLLKKYGINVDSDRYIQKWDDWSEFLKYDKKRKKKEIYMVYLEKKGHPAIMKRSLEEITKDLEELK
jgi:3-dehydroquinate synthase